MSDEDKKKTPKTDESQIDDDLDSLSQEEKSAFEKIMAEIAAAEGTSADASATSSSPKPEATDSTADSSGSPPSSDDNSDTDTVHTPDPAPDASDTTSQTSSAPNGNEDELTHEQQAAIDKIMAEIEGRSPSDADTADVSPAGGSDEEELSEEQQAALDKIMSEIKGGRNEDPPPAAQEPSSEKSSDDELTEDQQAALDKIMSEIKGSKSEDPPPATEKPAPEKDSDDELTEDQQAALDKIMSEIKGNKSEDPPPATEKPAPEKDSDDELTEDQQAALDKIMAEINDRKDAEVEAVTEPTTPSEDADEELSFEQQTALDKIMTEINDRKEAEAPQVTREALPEKASDEDLTEDQQAALDKIMAEINATNPSESDAADTSEKTDPPDADLSMDEFNEELTNLLKSVEGGPPESDPASPVDDSESTRHADTQTDPAVDPEPADGPRPSDAEAMTSDAKTEPYPLLKEVASSSDAERSSRQRNEKSATRNRPIKKVWQLVASVSILIILAGFGAWAYRSMVLSPAPPTPDRANVNHSPPSAGVVQSMAAVGQSEASIQKPDPIPPAAPTASPYAVIRQDLETARGRLLKKKQELQDLKVYYQKGIREEQSKIVAKTVSAKIDSFREAARDSQVELGLRSIQRRKIYLAKLDTPLNQINAALEELLYWQRRTQLLELLSQGISGLPVSEFKQEAGQIIQRHIEQSQTLSIENIQVATPKLADIYEELATRNVDNAEPSTRSAPPSQKDIDIAKEICDGNYEHLYLLAHLSDETAACLARWSGKDLYLNELTQLTPAMAKSLAKWPGEWLSLNGIQSLPAESAKYLAQWPGKRLSLNGLTRLSKNATAYLAQWKGEQLEMVGLNSIGRWENYVTRLYLSEELRKKLEMQ